jgi:hypothetical protein
MILLSVIFSLLNRKQLKAMGGYTRGDALSMVKKRGKRTRRQLMYCVLRTLVVFSYLNVYILSSSILSNEQVLTFIFHRKINEILHFYSRRCLCVNYDQCIFFSRTIFQVIGEKKRKNKKRKEEEEERTHTKQCELDNAPLAYSFLSFCFI